MKYYQFKYLKHCCCFVILLFFLPFVNAQEIVTTSGTTFSDVGGSASITVGQVSYQYVEDSGGSTSEGVQQLYVIAPLPTPDAYQGAVEALNKSQELIITKVYPNPTNLDITISHQGQDVSDLSYRLYDLQGRLISYQQLRSVQQQVPMQHLASGTYVLHICKNQIPVNSFKIIKN